VTLSRFASIQSSTGGACIIDDSILEVVGVECGVTSWIEDLTQREGHGTWDYWRRVSKEVLRFDEKFDDSNDPQLDDFVATLCGNRVREMYPSHIYWPTVPQCKRSLESEGRGGLRRRLALMLSRIVYKTSPMGGASFRDRVSWVSAPSR
jgi:hypothetical protein